MPTLYDSMVSQLRGKGKKKDDAQKIATAHFQDVGYFKKNTQQWTNKGLTQNETGRSERMKQRASDKTNGRRKPSDYKIVNGRAVLKNIVK